MSSSIRSSNFIQTQLYKSKKLNKLRFYLFFRFLPPKQHLFILIIMNNSNEDLSSTQKKVISIRKERRKYELEKYFEEKRQELLLIREQETLQNDCNESELKNLQHELDTKEKRYEVARQISLKIRGEPDFEWQQAIKNLKKITRFYDQQFTEWLSLDIFNSLFKVIRPEYFQANLAITSCHILTNVVYLVSKTPNKDILNKLMEYQFIPDVIAVCQNPNYSILEKEEAFNFLSNLCEYSYKYREKIIKDGGGTVLIEHINYLWNTNQVTVQNHVNAILYMHSYIRTFKQQTINKIANSNFVLLIIEILNRYLSSEFKGYKIFNLALKTVYEILMSQKQMFISNIYSQPNMIKNIISLGKFPYQFYKKNVLICIGIVGRIAYAENPKIMQELTVQGVLDLWMAELDQFSDRMLMRNGNIFIGNAATFGGNYSKDIFYHPIFERVVIRGLQFDIENIKRQSIFALRNLVDNLSYNEHQKLLQTYTILQTLMNNLTITKNIKPQQALNTLLILETLINRYEQVYHDMGRNKVLDKLERIYNFVNVIQNIYSTEKNRLVQETASRILDFIGQRASE